MLAASTSASSPGQTNENTSGSNSPPNTSNAPLQPSAKLEKLLAEADEAFWTSRRLRHMAGWMLTRTPRSPASGRNRRSTISVRSCTGEVTAALAAAATRGTLTSELLQHQLHQLAARNAGARRTTAAGADMQQSNLSSPAGSRRKENAEMAVGLATALKQAVFFWLTF